MVSALCDPERHFDGVGVGGGVVVVGGRRVGNGGHPAVVDAAAVDVERSDAAADGDGQPVPHAVGQSVVERLDARDALVRVVQPDLIFAPAALHFQESVQ